jgi:hypothetical protein
MALPFPATSQLSDFLDPSENPLYENGNWAQLAPSSPPMAKAGGSAGDSIHNGPNYSYWTRSVYYTPSIVEVWACTSGGQLGAALETWRVALFTTLGDERNGYLVYFGGAITKAFVIRRYDNGAFTELIGVGNAYPQKLGMRINGDNIEAWGEYGGVWSLQCSIVDTTYRGAFFLTIGIEDPTAGGLGMPCFGGGLKNRSQIIRYLHN